MIRFAEEKDISTIEELLSQVNEIHHLGRPDLFNLGRKYNHQQLLALLNDEQRPIFVYTDDNDNVLGYAFTVVQQFLHDEIRTDVKSLYIDDLCVEQSVRGQHIGETLYRKVCDYAKENGFYNVTLNVWACNEKALSFYKKIGMKVQKIGMETIL